MDMTTGGRQAEAGSSAGKAAASPRLRADGMTGRIANLDFARLERDGFLVLNGLIRPDELTRFERDIAVVGERLAAQRGVERCSGEPIADVLRAAGDHRSMLFDHIKRLFVVERL